MIGYLEQLRCDLESRLLASVERVAAAGFCTSEKADGSAAHTTAGSDLGEPSTTAGSLEWLAAKDWVQVRLVPLEKRNAYGVFTTNAALLLAQKNGGLRRCDAVDGEATASTGVILPSGSAYGAQYRQSDSATDIARKLMDELSLDGLPVQRVEIAEPGFLNFYLVDGWRQKALEHILSERLSVDAAPADIALMEDAPMDAAPTDTAPTEDAPTDTARAAVSAEVMPKDAVRINVVSSDVFRQLDFEIQYAYNRMCNQLELLAELGYQVPCVDAVHLELLTAPQEMRLMEHLAAAPFTAPTQASTQTQPKASTKAPTQTLTRATTKASAKVSVKVPTTVAQRTQKQKEAQQYLSQLASLFHQFFNISPIRGEDREIAAARISLLQGSRLVFESVLKESFF